MLVIKLVCNSLAEAPPLDGAEIVVVELVISLPAPNTKAPFELNVLFAVPTMLLAIPEYLFVVVADSILFKAPVTTAPKFWDA